MIYLDTSALVKTILDEDESTQLVSFLGSAGPLVSSALVRTELPRAVLRRDAIAGSMISEKIARLTLLALDNELLSLAGLVPPAQLGSLDAIHLASAAKVRDELVAFVSYDKRLLAAALAQGLPVASPGA